MLSQSEYKMLHPDLETLFDAKNSKVRFYTRKYSGKLHFDHDIWIPKGDTASLLTVKSFLTALQRERNHKPTIATPSFLWDE